MAMLEWPTAEGWPLTSTSSLGVLPLAILLGAASISATGVRLALMQGAASSVGEVSASAAQYVGW